MSEEYNEVRRPRESAAISGGAIARGAASVLGMIIILVVPVAQVLGIVPVGGAYFLMSWLALGIMVAGAKIISWSAGDREAVRRIIREALGPRTRV